MALSLYEKLDKLIIKDRIPSKNSAGYKWLEDELFFFDCNDLACEYYLEVYEKLKGGKLPNKNNSFVAYVIGITDIPPTRPLHGTPTTLPDIDYDTNARDPIKKYAVRKFGLNNVTLLGTVNTLKTKGAIKDVLRQLRSDMNFKEVNELTKHYDKLKRTDYKTEEEYLQAGLDEVPELKNYFDMNGDVLDAVKSILGEIKTTGVHAGGIVISGEDVRRKVACTFERKKDKMFVTQPDMKYVEWAGLIKYDFLGLNTLNDIGNTLTLIEKRHNVKLKMSDIPLNDPSVMKLFTKGDTMSIFQFGTFLAHLLLTQLKEVRNVGDLAIITSIARPGPLEMGMDKIFIRRVNGDEPITYLHPALEPILKDTFGIIVFQESVQEVMKKIGGLTKNESVVVLKAMGKKQLDKLEKFQKQFLDYAHSEIEGMDKIIDFTDPLDLTKTKKMTIAESIFNLCLAFASYGFNKCLALDSKVVDSSNKTITLESLKHINLFEKAIYLHSFDPKSKDLRVDRCLEYCDTGIKELFEVTFDNGIVEKCTQDHEFVCEDGHKRDIFAIYKNNHKIVYVER